MSNKGITRIPALTATRTTDRMYEAYRVYKDEKISMAEVARRFEVSYGTMRDWLARVQDAKRLGL